MGEMQSLYHAAYPQVDAAINSIDLFPLDDLRVRTEDR
jgi:hypothetical protein